MLSNGVLANLFSNRLHKLLFTQSKASIIRGWWPEAVTLDTLDQFLADIHYFEHPNQLKSIGLDAKPKKSAPLKQKPIEGPKVDHPDAIIDMLSKEVVVPPLDLDDVKLEGSRLVDLAISAGIYRDLFGTYKPDRELIKFTRDQAKKLEKFVPHFWITDQPFARSTTQKKQIEPLDYFVPFVGVSARFVKESGDMLEGQASYYGNFIPASEALVKPSITLDGHLLGESESSGNNVKEKHFNNWKPGLVEVVNFDNSDANKYYTIMLLNLDHMHGDQSNLHWMLANINPSKSNEGQVQYEEICDYLPVHGIDGFGYSRYVYLVVRHDTKLDAKSMRIDDFSLTSRKFDPKLFLNEHKSSANMIPIGLSWFQTVWDESSNKIFHDYLNIKAPVYEHIQSQLAKQPEKLYPGKAPFNLYLDHYRSKKSINEQVLLERLKGVDPFDYKDQYVPPDVPPTAFPNICRTPSWMYNVNLKKKFKLGYWRGLRPASAILPLNNNADLDYPEFPVPPITQSVPNDPNTYYQHSDKPKLKHGLKKGEDLFTQAKESEVIIFKGAEYQLDTVQKIIGDIVREKPQA